jgi:hypothetical protein
MRLRCRGPFSASHQDRAVIKELEDNDNEAAFERFYGNSDNHVSAGERAEQLHKMQQLK